MADTKTSKKSPVLGNCTTPVVGEAKIGKQYQQLHSNKIKKDTVKKIMPTPYFSKIQSQG